MDTLSEEYARRAVKLGNDDALCTVDDKRTIGRHVRDSAEINVRCHSLEIYVFRVGTVEFHLRLHRHAVSKTTLKTLLDGITRRVDEVVQELKYETVASVCDREVLLEHLVQTIVLTLLRRSVQLKEVLERLKLHVKEIRIWHRILDTCKVYSLIDFCCH